MTVQLYAINNREPRICVYIFLFCKVEVTGRVYEMRSVTRLQVYLFIFYYFWFYFFKYGNGHRKMSTTRPLPNTNGN